jgi:hypothetical protein
LAVLLLLPGAVAAAVAAACVAAASLFGCVVRGVGVRDLAGCCPVGDGSASSGTVAGCCSLPPLSDGLGVNRFLQQQRSCEALTHKLGTAFALNLCSPAVCARVAALDACTAGSPSTAASTTPLPTTKL